jgi:hypothetical protein
MSLRNKKSVRLKHNSSNNPYNHLIDNEEPNTTLLDQQDEERPVKRTSTKLSRRYTQKKPPSMAEFMTEFEQERRPSPPPTPALPTISAEEASMISFDESENFSDTARLTMNASAMSGFGSVNLPTSPSPSPPVPLPTSPKLYQPASIDPEIDRKKVHKLLAYDRKAFIQDTLNTIRSVAGRVVNLHQKRFDPNASSETDQNRQQQLQERRQEKIQRQTTREDDQDSDSSSVVDESIPMTSTASDYSVKTHQASAVSHTMPASNSIVIPSSPDTSRLYGYSFNVFSPQNSLRVFLYKMFCWK